MIPRQWGNLVISSFYITDHLQSWIKYKGECGLCAKFSTTKRGMLNFAYLFFPCLVPNSRRVKEEKDFVSVDGIFYAQLIFQFNCFKEEKFYKQYHSKFLPWIHFKSVSVAKLPVVFWRLNSSVSRK